MQIRRLLLVLAAAALLPPAISYAEILRVVYDEWPPYTGDSVPEKGFSTHLLVTALKNLGYGVSLTQLSAEDAEKGLIKGDYDLHPANWITERRQQFFDYSDPYLSNRLVIISSTRRLKGFQDLTELKGVRVGLSKGYGHPDSIMRAAREFKAVETMDAKDSLQQLMDSKIDAYIGDSNVARYLMVAQLQAGPGQCLYSARSIEERALHIVCSKKYARHAELIGALNSEIKKMKSNGEYDSILKTHGLQPLY